MSGLPPLQTFPRTAYPAMPARILGRRRTVPSSRGWGSGWPSCQPGKLVAVTVKRPRDGREFTVRVRSEIAELVGFLVAATFALGYDVRKADEPDGGVGSYSCRAIKGSNPPAPSWHSWGLALDVNSRGNPMYRLNPTRFRSTHPPAVVELWESSGFYWGGRYTAYADAMHFEYLFRPEDVATDLLNARRAFERLRPAEEPPPPEEDMPMITTPLVGHEAVIGDPASFTTVRDRPSAVGTVLRQFPKGQTETWTIVGWVTGEHSAFGNSDQWLARVAPDSGWEYTAKGNVREVKPSRLAQRAAATSAAVQQLERDWKAADAASLQVAISLAALVDVTKEE